MSGPLETDATLRAAIDSVDKTVAMTQEAKGWADSLSTFLKKVKKDIPDRHKNQDSNNSELFF